MIQGQSIPSVSVQYASNGGSTRANELGIIAASLLMEQVLPPRFEFKSKNPSGVNHTKLENLFHRIFADA